MYKDSWVTEVDRDGESDWSEERSRINIFTISYITANFF